MTGVSDRKKVVRWLHRIVRPYRMRILWGAAVDVGGMACSLAAIYLSKRAIDVATGAAEGDLWQAAGGMVGAGCGTLEKSGVSGACRTGVFFIKPRFCIP